MDESKSKAPVAEEIAPERDGRNRRGPVNGPIALQAAKFAISTGLSASLSLGLPIALVEIFNFQQEIAVATGFASAYIFNIILLKAFVFRSSVNWALVIAKYVPTNGAFRLFEYGLFLAFSNLFGIDYRIAIIGTLLFTLGLKFFAYRFIFERSSRRSPEV